MKVNGCGARPWPRRGRAFPNMATNFQAFYKLLHSANVESILIGGCAANLHGSPRSTVDMDVVYRRSRENMERIVACLAPFQPYLRGAPPGLPFKFDLQTMRNGLNFTLITELGDLDLLGEVTGGGTYEELFPLSERKHVFSTEVLCVNLDTLIRLKRAAGRPKDLEPIAELEGIRQERQMGRTDFHP